MVAWNVRPHIADTRFVLRPPVQEKAGPNFHIAHPPLATLFEWSKRAGQAQEFKIRKQRGKTKPGIQVPETEKSLIIRSRLISEYRVLRRETVLVSCRMCKLDEQARLRATSGVVDQADVDSPAFNVVA